MQRQCSTCRKKWSYFRLERRWVLAQIYSRQDDFRSAAQAAGVSQKTAAQVFDQFYTVLRPSEEDHWSNTKPLPRGEAEATILSALYERVFLPYIQSINQAGKVKRPARGH